MKILFIVPYALFPPDEGGRVRAYNLVKQLSRKHEVVILSPRSPANKGNDLDARLIETTQAGRRRQIFSPPFLMDAGGIARRERPDLVISEVSWPGLHAWYLARRAGCPMVVDLQNLEGDRFRSTGSRVWRAVDAYERLVLRGAARVLTVSDDDRERVMRRGVGGDRVVVVPNGVDPGVLRPDAEQRKRVRGALDVSDATRVVLFFGQLEYEPNRRALGLIERELLPRFEASGEDYRLVIVGKGEPEERAAIERRARVTWAGVVPKVGEYINAADVVIVPIESGGGTRLKIVEAVACGTPVVSTSIGAEGIDRGVCGEFLWVEDEWDAFARRALDTALVRSAPGEAFLDRYSWESIVGRVDWESFAR